MEEIVSKTELEYRISAYDLELINDYFTEVKKRSDGAARNQKHVILECLNHINKPITAISMLDVKMYFEHVMDKKPIKVESKESYKSYLKAFFFPRPGVFIRQGDQFPQPRAAR